jgi:predicted ATPase
MNFEILTRFQKPPYNAKSRAYLVWDNWNDYSFYTLFHLIYVDDNSTTHDIGAVKIGCCAQKEGERKFSTTDSFETLEPDFFSLGQSDEYYEALNNLGTEIRDEILSALRDIAKFPEIYEKAIQENVTKISLFRTISQTSVTGQFRRIASGGAKLTEYSFKFVSPKIKGSSSAMELAFHVEPEVFPPTNIHVLIGRNGVGKTHLINNMINSLVDENASSKFGNFISEISEDKNQFFANLTSITFSAFDETEPKEEQKDKTKGIQFSYIGLKQIRSNNKKNASPKSTEMLTDEFFKSLYTCKINTRNRWRKSIEMLESDPNFKEAKVKELIDIEDEEEMKIQTFDIFKKLSSGHKIVLLTITRLIETLQERSLVLIDEPEAHLHPPLLSAFTRTLSELLIETNSVSIIATHSPVILQEVPKSCVWKLRRTGAEAVAERLSIESFGENVGTLTNEIFGLEVTDSGYYKLIEKALEKNDDYESMLDYFSNQLGTEAKAIIMSLSAKKENLQ